MTDFGNCISDIILDTLYHLEYGQSDFATVVGW